MSDMTIQNAIHCMKAIICEEVCEECDYYGKTGTDHCEADAIRMAIKALEEQPKRKKGKWEEVQFRTIPYNRISKAKKCSVCGKRKDKYVTWNFCPNCGADMRGENNE